MSIAHVPQTAPVSELAIIARNFNRASQHYEHVSWVQKRAAHRLLSHIQAIQREQTPYQFPPPHILEWAAGTGYLSRLLHQAYPNAQWTFQDIAAQSLMLHRDRWPGVPHDAHWQVGDIRTDAIQWLTEKAPPTYWIANMGIQWLQPWSSATAFLSLFPLHASVCSKPVLWAFTGLLAGSFSSWYTYCEQWELNALHWEYPSAEQVQTTLTQYAPAFRWESWNETLWFANPKEALRHLQQLGAQAPRQASNPANLKRLLKHAETRTEPVALEYRLYAAILYETA